VHGGEGDCLAVAAVEDEGDLHAVTVPGLHLEDVRTPAQVRLQGDVLAVVGATRSVAKWRRRRRLFSRIRR
jgi:hypothetical protein